MAVLKDMRLAVEEMNNRLNRADYRMRKVVLREVRRQILFFVFCFLVALPIAILIEIRGPVFLAILGMPQRDGSVVSVLVSIPILILFMSVGLMILCLYALVVFTEIFLYMVKDERVQHPFT